MSGDTGRQSGSGFQSDTGRLPSLEDLGAEFLQEVNTDTNPKPDKLQQLMDFMQEPDTDNDNTEINGIGTSKVESDTVGLPSLDEMFLGQLESEGEIVVDRPQDSSAFTPIEETQQETSTATAVLEKPVDTAKTDAEKELQDATAKANKKSHKLLKRIAGLIGNLLFYLFVGTMLIGSTVFAFSKDPGKSYFGYRFYNVLSDSMVPNQAARDAGLTDGFKKGDLILVKLTPADEIQVGDIITFTPDTSSTAYLTHRVVEVRNSLGNTDGLFFVTRGDANNTDDPPISSEMVVGKKVFHIPYVGTIVQFVRQNFIPVAIFVVAAFALVIVLRMLLAKPTEEELKAADAAGAP